MAWVRDIEGDNSSAMIPESVVAEYNRRLVEYRETAARERFKLQDAYMARLLALGQTIHRLEKKLARRHRVYKKLHYERYGMPPRVPRRIRNWDILQKKRDLS